jgi:hypothetical protein
MDMFVVLPRKPSRKNLTQSRLCARQSVPKTLQLGSICLNAVQMTFQLCDEGLEFWVRAVKGRVCSWTDYETYGLCVISRRPGTAL